MIVALSSFPRRNYPLIFYYIRFMRVAIKISLLAGVFFLNYEYKLLVRRVRFERTNPKDMGLQPTAALQLCRLPLKRPGNPHLKPDSLYSFLIQIYYYTSQI